MTTLERICTAFGNADVRYAVVGGHAVALHGAVRGTFDIDVVLNWTKQTLARAEAALNGLGLVSRLPISAEDVFAFRDEYVQKRNLIAWNFYNPDDPVEQVDVIINYDLAAKRTKRIALSSGSVEILALADLIAMKRASGRPQDIEDVRALERL